MNSTRLTLLSSLAAAVVLIAGCAAPTGDGESGRHPSHAHSLGSDRAADSGARCSVGLTAPAGSPLKNQKIHFVVERSDAASWSTHDFPVSTGSSKTLAQLQALLGAALQRGLTAPAGTVLTKVGDIQYGGEVSLVARGGGTVDFAYLPVIEGGNPKLSPGETAVFARLLGK